MARTSTLGAALALAILVAGCTSEPPARTGTPLFYASMASRDAAVDPQTAAGMINLYRANHGLAPLTPDPALQAAAQDAVAAMAAQDAPQSAESLKARLARDGVRGSAVNVSAGYHTLAEAFSGWRESPVHNRTMLERSGARFGIATAYAPHSKYKVYWTLIVAPAGPA